MILSPCLFFHVTNICSKNNMDKTLVIPETTNSKKAVREVGDNGSCFCCHYQLLTAKLWISHLAFMYFHFFISCVTIEDLQEHCGPVLTGLHNLFTFLRLRPGGEGNDRGWDGWMASTTWWTWVWASSGSWWTGKPGMLQSVGSQRVRHDWATELNWEEVLLTLSYRWKQWGWGLST